MIRLRLHPAALAELDAAVSYMEDRHTGFGSLLLEEVGRRIAQATRFPNSGAPVAGFGAHYDVRKFVAKRFRYLIITAIIKQERMVIAVAHMGREPGYWRVRLR